MLQLAAESSLSGDDSLKREEKTDSYQRGSKIFIDDIFKRRGWEERSYTSSLLEP